jgi:O-antigen ligase
MLTAPGALARFGFFSVFGLSSVCLVITFARASFVSAAVALWTVALVERRKLLFPMTIITLVALFSPAVFEWTEETFVLFDMGMTSRTWDRIPIAIDAVRIWQEHPLFGIGFGPYGRYSDVLVWFSARNAWAYVGSAHNDFLQVLVDVGLIGLGLYIWVLLAIGRQATKALANTADWFRRGLGVAFIGVFVGYLVENVASELILGTANNGDYLNLSIRIYFWAFLGMITAMNMLPSARWRKGLEFSGESPGT